ARSSRTARLSWSRQRPGSPCGAWGERIVWQLFARQDQLLRCAGTGVRCVRQSKRCVACQSGSDYRWRVDFDAYAHAAADIVNARLSGMADLQAMFGAGSWQAAEATERDLAVIRRAQRRLRDVFELGSA